MSVLSVTESRRDENLVSMNNATVENYSTNFTIIVERALAGYDFTSAHFIDIQFHSFE